MQKEINVTLTATYAIQASNKEDCTYSLRHWDLVQLQGLRGRVGGEDSGEVLKQQQKCYVHNYDY